ncbi:hypothetical protein HKBW3C_02989, partial [Candidatus Hakubella thermalkaliphila]
RNHRPESAEYAEGAGNSFVDREYILIIIIKRVFLIHGEEQ